MRQHFIVLSIGGRDVAWTEWPYIRRFEHFLKLLDVVNDAFNRSTSMRPQSSRRKSERSNQRAFIFLEQVLRCR
jgi:hypothetical protein